MTIDDGNGSGAPRWIEADESACEVPMLARQPPLIQIGSAQAPIERSHWVLVLCCAPFQSDGVRDAAGYLVG